MVVFKWTILLFVFYLSPLSFVHLFVFPPFVRLKTCYHCYYHRYWIINSLCSFFVKAALGQ